jgi:DnaJ-class molecular chaperone
VKALSEQSLYEVLEIPRSATPQEVQRAYERARALFGPGSLASYTLLAPEEAEALLSRIEEARSVLLDREARATYDDRLPGGREAKTRPPQASEGTRSASRSGASIPVDAPAAAAGFDFRLPEGTPWTGDLLRRARESRGLTTQQVSERTKIQRSHIESVEAERFEQLPPPVYLRGIVLSIATALRLDDPGMVRSYMERAAGARAAAKER